MLDTQLRVKIQPAFDLLSRYITHRITPNTITLCALFFGIIAGYAISYHYTVTALCFLWLSGICDVLDGTIARLQNTTSLKGSYIDLISDRMVESALILGFTIGYPQHYIAYILFLIGLLLHFSTFLAMAALVENTGIKNIHYDRTIVERAEAFIIFSLMLLFPSSMFWILMTFNLLVFASALSRFYRIITIKS